jgi:hypothetical protein
MAEADDDTAQTPDRYGVMLVIALASVGVGYLLLEQGLVPARVHAVVAALAVYVVGQVAYGYLGGRDPD